MNNDSRTQRRNLVSILDVRSAAYAADPSQTNRVRLFIAAQAVIDLELN